jgi:hypothetical protein
MYRNGSGMKKKVGYGYGVCPGILRIRNTFCSHRDVLGINMIILCGVSDPDPD